ncbi:MAG: hypothetical protein IJ781_02075, partial [Atopobiaceae bacterium]|nr:hypothetical protein [Atopobiaceae bacterium]
HLGGVTPRRSTLGGASRCGQSKVGKDRTLVQTGLSFRMIVGQLNPQGVLPKLVNLPYCREQGFQLMAEQEEN